jgi:purine-binding chemotaxis protein CheW
MEVLVFTVGNREHALPVEDVIEVVRMVAVTPLPDAPASVMGVINMRGRIIPVIDLRTRLGMPPHDPDLSAPIIVVGRSEAAAGLVADGASEVLTLRSTAVEAPTPSPGPRSSQAPAASAVSGMAHEGDRLILLLDAQRLCEEAARVSQPLGE